MKAIRKYPFAALVLLRILSLPVLGQSTYSTPDTFITIAGLAGTPGTADGTRSAARFNRPWGVVVDSSGNLFVTDTYNHTIRKITPSGVVSTLAGTPGLIGSSDGTNAAARFYEPKGVALDGLGNLFVADVSNHTIRKLTPVGTNWVVTTLAGLAGNAGSADGTNSTARFYYPCGLAVDNMGNLYVADAYNHAVRKLTPAGTNWVVTTVAGLAGNPGTADGTGSAARFYFTTAVAVDTTGNIYVSDSGNSTIRKIMPGGVVTTVAGSPGVIGSANGTGSAARFRFQAGIATDGAGNLYVADSENHTIRMGIVPAVFSIGLFPVLTLTNMVGTQLRIEVTDDLVNTNSWTTLTNLTLTTSPYYFVDTNSPLSVRRFYRTAQP